MAENGLGAKRGLKVKKKEENVQYRKKFKYKVYYSTLVKEDNHLFFTTDRIKLLFCT